LWPLLLACLTTEGCGPSGTPVIREDPTRQNLEKIGDAYIRATIANNRPPANLDELVRHLRHQGDPQKILFSPNDEEPFVIVWGVELRRLKARGDAVPVIAYEKKGKDGQRRVLRGRADVVLLTESQLRAATFPSDFVFGE
jgi:hypothetical protein